MRQVAAWYESVIGAVRLKSERPRRSMILRSESDTEFIGDRFEMGDWGRPQQVNRIRDTPVIIRAGPRRGYGAARNRLALDATCDISNLHLSICR